MPYETPIGERIWRMRIAAAENGLGVFWAFDISLEVAPVALDEPGDVTRRAIEAIKQRCDRLGMRPVSDGDAIKIASAMEKAWLSE